MNKLTMKELKRLRYLLMYFKTEYSDKEFREAIEKVVSELNNVIA